MIKWYKQTKMEKLKAKRNKLNEKGILKYRAYYFSLETIKFLEKLPHTYVAHEIGKQLLRSATSIGANIVEAQAGTSRKDFARFYHIALKSANETKYWLCLLRDGNVAKNSDAQSILTEAVEIANMLASSILTLKGKKSF